MAEIINIVLQRLTGYLLDNLIVTADIIAALIARDLLRPEQAQVILASVTDRDKVFCLLSYIRSPEDYGTFVGVLRENFRSKDVARRLDEEFRVVSRASPLDNLWYTVLKNKTEFVCSNLIPEGNFLRTLQSCDVLDASCIERINHQTTTSEKVFVLLQMIRGQTQFEAFMNALQADHSFIYEELRQEVMSHTATSSRTVGTRQTLPRQAAAATCSDSGDCADGPMDTSDNYNPMDSNSFHVHQLLTYRSESDTFQLDRDALSAIRNARGPFKLLSAVGDARLGKSTFTNALVCLWPQLHGAPDVAQYREYFEVGHLLTACTKGVRMCILPAQCGTYIILDVEGINLGNDAVTTQLSLFTALISSEVMLFGREVLNNHALQFLHHIARLKETEYANLNEAELALLRLILRDPHDAPPGMTLRESVVDGLTYPNRGDGQDEARSIIRKYFRRDQINVDSIPSVARRDRTNNTNWPVTDVEYSTELRKIAGKLLNIPEKRTLHGASLDGDALVDIMQKLVATIKTDDWGSWMSDWLMFETQLSRRAYDQFIRPLLEREGTSEEIQAAIPAAMEGFQQLCVLPDEVTLAAVDLQARVQVLHTREQNEQLAVQREEDMKKLDQAAGEIDSLKSSQTQTLKQMETLNAAVKQAREESEQLRRKLKDRKFLGFIRY